MTDVLESYSPGWAAAHRARTGRPFVTLSYAQSLDGSITLRRGRPSPISGDESKRITHALRAVHDAILIGVETVLADDPRLTARRAGGPDPQPVVVDSRLRFPLSARLLHHPHGVWIATTNQAAANQVQALEARGARIFCLPAATDGRVELGALLDRLGEWQVDSLMVEGGSQVISSFLRGRLVDRLVLTIAPVVAGGYPAVQALGIETWGELPRLRQMKVAWAGTDLMVWGDLA